MNFTVPQELDGITVQNFLRKYCQVSARLLAKLKRVENGITSGGKLIRSIDILHSGDIVELLLPEKETHSACQITVWIMYIFLIILLWVREIR